MIMEDPEWELVDPDFGGQLPPRSRLVNLAPIGLGTAQVESLGSYFMRLADTHSLKPTSLAWEVVFPERSDNSWACEDGWKHPYFNGIGLPTQEWVSRLERLTKVDGINSLTLGFLRGRVSTLGLVSKNNRWCPTCFKEDAEQGIPYGRLLWTLNTVTCCLKHQTKLIGNCNCDKKSAWTNETAKPLSNICGNCSRDLGRTQIQQPKPANSDEMRRAELVADLLLGGSTLAEQTPDRDIADFLEHSIRFHFDGKASRLGQRLDISKSTLHGWIHRRHFPSFTQIIAIAESHGCSIANVLCGRSDVVNLNVLSKRVARTKMRFANSRRILDWDAIDKALNEYLHVELPPTLVEVAKQLGISRYMLRRNRPSICRAISAKWIEWSITMANHRAHALESEVRKAAQSLMEQGVNPTRRKILKIASPLNPITRVTPRIAAIFMEICMKSKRNGNAADPNAATVSPN